MYDFKNKETGEVIEKLLRISQLDEWKAENPDWEQVMLSAPGLVSDSKTPLKRAGTEWEDKLKRIKERSGKANTINV